MNTEAGFLKMLCIWMQILILMQGLDAGPAPKNATDAPCRPKELTALTKCLVEASLMLFDKANGNDLDNWYPGFPELQVDANSSLNGSKAQCSLLFMAQGLEQVLQDQKNNLNPKDGRLHQKLKHTISRVNGLAECVKITIGGECSQKPSTPNMPKHVFERKMWSHTLLKSAKTYLYWLWHKIEIQLPSRNKIKRVVSKETAKRMAKIKRRVTESTRQNYFEGSGYLL